MKIFWSIIVILVVIVGGYYVINNGNIENTQTDITNEENTPTSMTEENTANKIVTMKTSMGDIEIELFLMETPVTAGNFLSLAETEFYNGIRFHRVIPGFMVQGGDPLTKDDDAQARWGTGGPGYTIDDEFAEGLSNERGTLSMANAGPNTGGSQFFINVADNTFLDGKHAVFGKVITGMDVVDAIVNVPTADQDRPVESVTIESIIVN